MNNYNQYNRGGKISPYNKPVPKYFLGGMLNQFFGSVLGGGGGGSTTPPTTPPTAGSMGPGGTGGSPSGSWWQNLVGGGINPPWMPPASCPPGWHWDNTQQACVEDEPNVGGFPSTNLEPTRATASAGEGGPCPQPTVPQPQEGPQGGRWVWDSVNCKWIGEMAPPVEQAISDTPRSTQPGPNQTTGLSTWWKDRQKLMGIAGGRGRRGARSVMDVRGPIKEGGSPGGEFEDLVIEEENPLIAGGSPYLYKNVMGFQQGGRLNRGDVTVTGEEFKSFNKSMAQIGLGIINSFGGKKARGRFIDGGKF